MNSFKIIGVLLGGLCLGEEVLADSGFGSDVGRYNPYSGYSVANQAAFVGENMALQGGVMGLNALAQRAYKWGNSFQKPNKDTRGQFGRYPHSYVRRSTLARYLPRVRKRDVLQSGAASLGPQEQASGPLSAKFIQENNLKPFVLSIAKWRSLNLDQDLKDIKRDSQSLDRYYKNLEKDMEASAMGHKKAVENAHSSSGYTQAQWISLANDLNYTSAAMSVLMIAIINREVAEAESENRLKQAFFKWVKNGGKEEPLPSHGGNVDDEDEERREPQHFLTYHHPSHAGGSSSSYAESWVKSRTRYLTEARSTMSRYFNQVPRRGSFFRESKEVYKGSQETLQILKQWDSCYRNPSSCSSGS